MRINSKQSIETANTVYDQYGSWKAVRSAAKFEDGKYIVVGQPASAPTATSQPNKKASPPAKPKG